ncbi:hypothetical protein, partial [Helicobacter marmotae]|uniref:hypothetical protein n=1 Tax=Helicobacter marmotae TaxID=152490 RepID=UPI00131578FC
SNRDSSLDSQAQNDKLTTFTRNPSRNDSQKAKSNSSACLKLTNLATRKERLKYFTLNPLHSELHSHSKITINTHKIHKHKEHTCLLKTFTS